MHPYDRATVGENMTPITGKVYPHSTASPVTHTKQSQTLRHARVSCTLAENRPQFRLNFWDILERTAPFSDLPRHGMIRRCRELAMTATNVSCEMVIWRRASTRGSTVCLLTIGKECAFPSGRFSG